MPGKNAYRPLIDDGDTEDDALRSAAEAVLDRPSNMRQYGGRAPKMAAYVYGRVLRAGRGDLHTLFEIARYSETPAVWSAFVSHAIDSKSADLAAYMLIRSKRQWKGERGPLGTQIRRLTCLLSPKAARHFIHACNPRRHRWFRDMVDLDVLWYAVIVGLLDRGRLRCAFEALLQAGRGYMVRGDDLLYAACSVQEREFYWSVKDWRRSDQLGWRTYGRSGDFESLVRLVWDAHVECGRLEGSFEYGRRGKSRVPVGIVDESGDLRSVVMAPLPYAGLVARLGDVKALKRLQHRRVTCGPDIDGAVLTEEGGMLQQLIVHYLVPRNVMAHDRERHPPRKCGLPDRLPQAAQR
jgi:hypothetical protein